MERGKGSSGRGGKSKTPQFPADLYALGSKSTTENKQRPGTHQPTKVGSTAERERKRDGSAINAVPAKKSKLSSTLLGRGSSQSSSSSGTFTTDTWEAVALECDPSDLVASVLEALEVDDSDKTVGYICGAIKLLRSQRQKPDAVTYMSLAYLAKLKKHLFTNDYVISGLCSLLKKDSGPSSFKTLPIKTNQILYYLVINIFTMVFQDTKRWPETFIKIYLDDAGGDRSWVDNELCKSFVDNILLSLNTKQVTIQLPDPTGRTEQSEDDVPELRMNFLDQIEPVPPISRFRWNKDSVEGLVLETVKEQLARRQSSDLINRNFLKMLTSLCGLTEVRLLIASRLEAWLQNPKLMRPAQELLMSLCVNCTAHSIKDVEIISNIIKMRLKTKALINYYLLCIKELVSAHHDNLNTVLKHTIYNELSTSRNPNNMAMLNVMFQHDPDRAAVILADIFQELLLNRDEYLRPLRALLRELARVLRSELKLQEFSRGLMGRTDPLPKDVENVRAFLSTIDLISLCLFLAVMPNARSDKRDVIQLERMQMNIASIQSDCLWWLQEGAPGIYKPAPADFVHAIMKVMLLEPSEQYYKIDTWPPEQDRSLFMRMASEVPILESTLVSLLAIGVSKDLPLTPSDAFEITDQIIKRAASITNPILPVLKVENRKILDLVFNLSTYRHPDNIDLPQGYKPPPLAISTLYWKGWTLLLILCAHNPAKFGAAAWDKYPTLRILMEMCITSHFVFPPGFDDIQLLNQEKHNILQFESYLAAASTKMEITEETSLLVPQLISLDPLGAPRRPPPTSLEAIKSLNNPLKLGHLLCRSRAPDFLLDIIQRQGASQSMPWLADLVHNSDGALSHLPVQCLCEFLLTTGQKQDGIYQQLLAHLQNILTDPNQDSSLPCDILEYFLRRLSSPVNRGLAINGLKLVLSPPVEESNEEVKTNIEVSKDDPSWLMRQLPTLPHFNKARPQIIDSLRSACQVENEPELITSYLCFLAEHGVCGLTEMGDLVLDMAQLIVERSTIMSSILAPVDTPNAAIEAFLTIFFTYLTKAREPRKEKYPWSESQDQVLVTWPSGEECTVHILVVHAMVILLTYGPDSVNPWTHRDQYYHLLDTWFPQDYSNAPKGFLVDTSEEALLIPDWLKLRMIRSHVPRLVEAALQDLEISQLILFIQSFGIPIASMSKLLSTLDAAVISDRSAVGEAVIDKQYMIQLVEVQHRRGAVGGETFIRVLDLQEPARPQAMEVDVPIIKKEKPERRVRSESVYLTDEEGIAALDRMYCVSYDSYEQKSAKIAFTHLQRTLVHEIKAQDGKLKNRTFLKEVMRYLLKRATTDQYFIHHILSKPQFSCPLFRLLTTLHPYSQSLLMLAMAIVDYANFPYQKPKALVDLLKQYVSKQDNAMETKKKVNSEVSSDINMKKLMKTMEKLKVCPKSDAGKLVDKLVKLEPEILGSKMDMQMELLFSATEFDSLQCRPYLLTLLTHHASWQTLSNCIELLLRKESLPRYDPTPVLDFLNALTCNPKLWQGREKHTAKHAKPENVLDLNLEQLKCMIDYIVTEGIQLENNRVPNSRNRIANRLQFLENCIRATEINFAADLAQHLMKRGSSLNVPRNESKMCHQLLIQLYMRIPSLISHLKENAVSKIFSKFAAISVAGTSTLDSMSHCLITALAATPNSKEWPKRAVELELAVRKMAATHPLLVLRQLPLIASSLKGRVDLDWNVIKFRNHLLLFQQISMLLELLQPLIFQSEFAEPLHKILDVYFDLFQNHSREGASVSALVTQITAFLHSYVKKNSKQAQAYLKTQAEAISDLRSEHHSMATLCVIVSDSKGMTEVILTPKTVSDHPHPQWEAKVSQLYANKEDPIQNLSFIEYHSTKRPGLLGPIFPTICTFLSSPVSQIRNCASTITLRYMKYKPQAASEALPILIDCLDSRNPDIMVSVLEKVPELVVCCQEIALPLLQKVFSLGINKNMNTQNCIVKSIVLLNQQAGC